MIFFTRRRSDFFFPGSRVENIIIKFFGGFSKEVNFWISRFISFLEYLLGRFFLSS